MELPVKDKAVNVSVHIHIFKNVDETMRGAALEAASKLGCLK